MKRESVSFGQPWCGVEAKRHEPDPSPKHYLEVWKFQLDQSSAQEQEQEQESNRILRQHF